MFQEKRPSWLYELNHGATTFWESWGAIDEKGTRQRCSYNHYAFGSVGHWFYTGIAGLNPTEAGYKSFLIKPLPEARMTAADLSLKTVYGRINEHWHTDTENETFYLMVEVPVNTRCTVILPDGSSHEIGSGKYSFSCKY